MICLGGCLHLASQLTSQVDSSYLLKNENFELSPSINLVNPLKSRKLSSFTTFACASASAMILFRVIESSWMEIKLLKGDVVGWKSDE